MSHGSGSLPSPAPYHWHVCFFADLSSCHLVTWLLQAHRIFAEHTTFCIFTCVSLVTCLTCHMSHVFIKSQLTETLRIRFLDWFPNQDGATLNLPALFSSLSVHIYISADTCGVATSDCGTVDPTGVLRSQKLFLICQESFCCKKRPRLLTKLFCGKQHSRWGARFPASGMIAVRRPCDSLHVRKRITKNSIYLQSNIYTQTRDWDA